jgi:ABC-type multidrug transport system fused ATPase/permease subunit
MKKYIEAVKSASSVLPKGDKSKILTVSMVQVSLSFLDLLGIALIGIIGALSITGIQGRQVGDRSATVLRLFSLETLSLYNQVLVLAILSVLILTARSLLSMYFSRRYLRFLATRSAGISSNLFSKLISQSIVETQKRSTQENLFIVTHGVSQITIGILGNLVLLISDFSLLIVLTLGLFYLDPIVAFVTLILFVGVAAILQRRMSSKAQNLGKRHSDFSIKSNRNIVESLSSFRETFVRNRRAYYAKKIESQRLELSLNDAQLVFLPLISKYVLESAVIIGAFLVCALQFAFNDSRQAIATLTIFLAAGSRIGPAILRVQQGLIQIGVAIGSAQPTFELIEELKYVERIPHTSDSFKTNHLDFNASMKVSNLSFSYDPTGPKTISDISFELPAGQTLAIVGTSGAGKTTLVDLLLGILQPSSGEILISNCKPSEAISRWPGAISYVPQSVAIVEGTLRENICMGFSQEEIDNSFLQSAITGASLDTFVSQSPLGLESQVGEVGSKISGGERQRIGIARSLLTNPKLLILDEATSSLDGETEAMITDSIQSMKGKVTLVVIAHRLSTVRNASLVLYLDKGKVLSLGTFEHVRKAIPNFDIQAKLMGL